MGSSSSTGEVNREEEMYQRRVNELKQSIKGLNTEFHRNHQTLTDKIKELNDIKDELKSVKEETTVRRLVGLAKGIADTLGSDLTLTKSQIDQLIQKFNGMKELQQMKQLNGTIDTLLQKLDHYKITVQNQSKAEEIISETQKIIPQMRETAAQFQKTLN